MITSTRLLCAGFDDDILNRDWETKLLNKNSIDDFVCDIYTKAEVRSLLNVYVEKLDELRRIAKNYEYNMNASCSSGILSITNR